MIAPLEIKKQVGATSYFCTGCVIASIAEPYVGQPCDEAYSFAMGRKVSGKDLYGLDPKSALRGAIRYGVLPKSKSPFTGKEPREFLQDWRNWEPYMRFAAKPFASFRRTFTPTFDQRNVTYMAGIFWQAEWDNSPYIESMGEYNKFTPHEVRILGEKDDYYVLQNSRGTDVGDGGLWYYKKSLPFHHIFRLTTDASVLDRLLEQF